jgi:hypothetical protein
MCAASTTQLTFKFPRWNARSRRLERLDNMGKKAALMNDGRTMATKHSTATSVEDNNNTR